MSRQHDELIVELTNFLTIQDFSPKSVGYHRQYARTFLDYLAKSDLSVDTVTPHQVDQYFSHAMEEFQFRYGRVPSPRWHTQPQAVIVKLLRLAQGEWPPEPKIIGPDAGLRHEICHEYETWLYEERGLAGATVARLMREANSFLRWRFDHSGAAGLGTLNAADVDFYIDMRTPGFRRTSLAEFAGRLRSLLRYLHRMQLIPTDLAPHIIGPKLYAYEDVPSALDSRQVAAVLAATKKDRSPRGLRDYAMLVLLATYGLREGEVLRLRLDDINWREESFRIRHTKTNACSSMPLLMPVGEALLDYLRLGRPKVDCREVFIRSFAPYTAMQNLYGMVRGRLARAGIKPVGRRGPHAFRHARAVELLRASVPQKIIGDLLGHRSAKSTDVYLKLATEDLRAIALDVPGSEVLS